MNTAMRQLKSSLTQIRSKVALVALVLTTLASASGALAATVTTPALISDGHMNCLIVNGGTRPVVVQSWSLVPGFGGTVTWGGRLAPFTLPPGGVESIDTVDDGGGALFCQVDVLGSTKSVRVSIISRDGSTMRQTGVAQGY